MAVSLPQAFSSPDTLACHTWSLWVKRYHRTKDCQKFLAPVNVDVNVSLCSAHISSIVQSHRLTLFGHIVRTDDNTDAKKILSPLPPEDWSRPQGRPRITWLSRIWDPIILHCLKQLIWYTQNWSPRRMWSTYGNTQSWVACQKWQTIIIQKPLMHSMF